MCFMFGSSCKRGITVVKSSLVGTFVASSEQQVLPVPHSTDSASQVAGVSVYITVACLLYTSDAADE